MWIELEDGWRDESSEGPYTAVLQTLWSPEYLGSWEISRLRTQQYHEVSLKGEYHGCFKTVLEAKEYIKHYDARKEMSDWISKLLDNPWRLEMINNTITIYTPDGHVSKSCKDTFESRREALRIVFLKVEGEENNG